MGNSMADEHIPKMYGGTGPDPDPTGHALMHRVREAAAARRACASEAEYIDTVVAQYKADGWKWEDMTVDGFAPYVTLTLI